MKQYYTLSNETNIEDDCKVKMEYQIRERLIDDILLYSTDLKYNYKQLLSMSLDDLYAIKRKIG